jgi:hypothetical protein
MKTTPWLAGWQARPDEGLSDDPPALFARRWGCGATAGGGGRQSTGRLRLPSYPGAASLARPGFVVYVTRGGPGPMTTQYLLGVGATSHG